MERVDNACLMNSEIQMIKHVINVMNFVVNVKDLVLRIAQFVVSMHFIALLFSNASNVIQVSMAVMTQKAV